LMLEAGSKEQAQAASNRQRPTSSKSNIQPQQPASVNSTDPHASDDELWKQIMSLTERMSQMPTGNQLNSLMNQQSHNTTTQPQIEQFTDDEDFADFNDDITDENQNSQNVDMPVPSNIELIDENDDASTHTSTSSTSTATAAAAATSTALNGFTPGTVNTAASKSAKAGRGGRKRTTPVNRKATTTSTTAPSNVKQETFPRNTSTQSSSSSTVGRVRQGVYIEPLSDSSTNSVPATPPPVHDATDNSNALITTPLSMPPTPNNGFNPNHINNNSNTPPGITDFAPFSSSVLSSPHLPAYSSQHMYVNSNMNTSPYTPTRMDSSFSPLHPAYSADNFNVDTENSSSSQLASLDDDFNFMHPTFGKQQSTG